MNTESINIEHGTPSNCADLTTKPVSWIRTLYRRVVTVFVRSELEKAQAGYRQKQQHRSPVQQDILSDMPVETKQALGMHRWIN